MSILQVFKSKVPHISFFFKNGKQAPFINGKFITEIESEIDELRAEIGQYINPVLNDKNQVVSHDGVDISKYIGSDKSRHPHIYIDPDESELDTEAPSYEDKIRAQERAKVLAEIAAQTNAALVPSNNVSNSDAGKTAASFASTANLNGLDGLVPVPALIVPATPAPNLVPKDLQDKIASLQKVNPTPAPVVQVVTSATVAPGV
jgi:hypothetical protein